MSSLGRGKYFLDLQGDVRPLRRPKKQDHGEGFEELKCLLFKILAVDLDNSDEFNATVNAIKSYCSDKERLWIFCQKMYRSGATSCKMSKKITKIWRELSDFEVQGIKLRALILSKAQKDYSDREEILKESPEQFLRSVALLGHIMDSFTLPGGKIFDFLLGPMVDYLKLLVKKEYVNIIQREAELKMVVTQINNHGKALKEHAKEAVAELSQDIRCMLTCPLPPSNCRYWLLLAFDLTLYGCDAHEFPDCLKKYYIKKLGDSFKALMGIQSNASCEILEK